jgi:hypothetical protein
MDSTSRGRLAQRGIASQFLPIRGGGRDEAHVHALLRQGRFADAGTVSLKQDAVNFGSDVLEYAFGEPVGIAKEAYHFGAAEYDMVTNDDEGFKEHMTEFDKGAPGLIPGPLGHLWHAGETAYDGLKLIVDGVTGGNEMKGGGLDMSSIGKSVGAAAKGPTPAASAPGPSILPVDMPPPPVPYDPGEDPNIVPCPEFFNPFAQKNAGSEPRAIHPSLKHHPFAHYAD